MFARSAPITEHPDLMDLHARFEQAAETPTAQAVDGMTVLAGLYVALSPWIVGFEGDPRLTRNNLVIGLTIAFLGLAFSWAYDRTHRMSWVCPVLGVWTILAVWLIAGTGPGTAATVSNIIAGAVVVLLGLAAMAIGMQRRPLGRRAATTR
jgi:hypothetical protein